jgi:hypothetical protein
MTLSCEIKTALGGASLCYTRAGGGCSFLFSFSWSARGREHLESGGMEGDQERKRRRELFPFMLQPTTNTLEHRPVLPWLCGLSDERIKENQGLNLFLSTTEEKKWQLK